jgi:sorbitol/mannitol transport system substrate-binding protein
VGIPEFQELGTKVSQQFAAVIAGTSTLDDALARAQQLAEDVGKKYRK